MGDVNMGLFVPVMVRRIFVVYLGGSADFALVAQEDNDRIKKSRVPDARLSNSLEWHTPVRDV